MIKKNINRREDEMQISQPDLRIVPRKQDKQKQQNGARAQSKTPQVATSNIDGAFNPTMQESKNMQFYQIKVAKKPILEMNGQQ